MPIVKILIESGAINAGYLFIYNVTLLSGSQSLEFMAQVVSETYPLNKFINLNIFIVPLLLLCYRQPL